MSKFASKTNVDSIKSRMEIERIVLKYGCTQFSYMTKPNAAVIGFKSVDRFVKMELRLPTLAESSVNKVGATMSAKQAQGAWEQQIRQRWRALALVVKAKLESVELGVATFEQEFMPYILLPNGETVGSSVTPLIAQAYSSGKTPQILLN